MLIIIIIVLIILGFVLLFSTLKHSASIEGMQDIMPDVPLNRFTLKEPDYFFYNPIIVDNLHYNRHKSKDDSTESTGIDDIFGPDNYIRYQEDDIIQI